MSDEMPTLGFWKIAEEEPDRLAIADPDHNEISYGDLYTLVNQISHGLTALGLEEGDHVATTLPNGIEQVALCLAAFQQGLYITTVNWHLVGPEIAYILGDAESKVFVTHERFGDEATRAADEAGLPAEARFSIGEVEGFRPFSEMIDGQPANRPENLSTGSFMFYTSGTTGRPKGVRRDLPDVHPDETGARSGGLMMLFGKKPHDGHVHITMAPLYHTAVSNWAHMSLHWGHPVVLMDRFTAEGALERIQKYRVTHSHMVPTMFHRMLALPESERAKYDVSSLRCMIHAAAPCPVETKQKMLDWWGDVIWEYYAATEGGGTIVNPEQWRRFPGTVGQPWPISEVKIFDDDGNEVPTGASGTIYMRMEGNEFKYYKDEAKTDKARREDFFTVGDIGYFNEEGFLFLNDRANDMIIVGGVNIYPAEIEGALHQHEKIGDVAVFGVPNEDTGEEIKAVVELVPGIPENEETLADIMSFCRDRMAKQKWPRSIDFTTEMPRDPNGKLYKRKLRDPYWEGRERNIV
ncbi:acyl-CoA synthetase [Myxococcota bacterium]|nr:acyl-CoA synthetase [Myxococcota bacterium]